MERKFKGLVAISDVLDDRYQKLSDKYHELELSHNRKKKALERIIKFIDRENPGFRNFLFTYDFAYIYAICEKALFCDGREKQCLKVKKWKVNTTSKGSMKNASSLNLEK